MADDSQRPRRDVTAAVGEVIDERYRVTAFIGDGGMGSVFRAEHVKLRKPVALKLLHKSLAKNADFAERFEREAMAAGRIDHPNCVAVSDFGRLPNGSLYLVMELVEGRTLGELLRDHRRLPVPRALHIARHALRALAHAHSVGIVHRDVKPDNILLVDHEGDRDFAKLLDFGIAKLVGEAANELEDAQLTQIGTTVGTPKYMPPEQAFGKDVDARADLYSLSVVLYTMLAGRAPFESDDVIDLLMQHASTDPPRFSDVDPNLRICREVEELVRKGLAKKRDDRFASAEDYLAALEEALDAYHAARLRGDDDSSASANGAAAAGGSPYVSPTLGVVSLRPARIPWWQRQASRQVGLALGGVALLTIIVIAASGGGGEPLPVPARSDNKLEAALDLLESGAKALASQPPSQLAKDAKALNEAGKHREVLSATTGVELDGYAHFERGRALAGLGRPADALGQYIQALEQTPVLRNNETALQLARTSLAAQDSGLALSAAELLVRFAPEPKALERLIQIASESKDRRARQRARTLTIDLGHGDQLNQVRSYALDLVQETTCEKRRAALLKLGDLGDNRALPAIKQARHRMRGGVLGIGEENTNTCLRADAERIIAELEGS